MNCETRRSPKQNVCHSRACPPRTKDHQIPQPLNVAMATLWLRDGFQITVYGQQKRWGRWRRV